MQFKPMEAWWVINPTTNEYVLTQYTKEGAARYALAGYIVKQLALIESDDDIISPK